MVTPDLDALMVKILELQTRSQKIAVIVDQITKEIEILMQLEAQLEENLIELKRENVVALAEQYKKAKDDLKKTKDRLSYCRIDRETYARAYAGHDRALKELRKDYAKGLHRVQNNVIKGNFGKKDGR